MLDEYKVQIYIALAGLLGVLLRSIFSLFSANKSVDLEAGAKLRDQLLAANDQYQLQLQAIKAELDQSKRDNEEMRKETIEIGHSLQNCLSENIRLKKGGSVS